MTTPATLSLIRALWITDHPRPAIVARVRARLGIVLTEEQVWVIARDNGMKRSPAFRSRANLSSRVDAAFTAAWVRWAEPGRPADNAVRLVESETFRVAGGFRIGVGP